MKSPLFPKHPFLPVFLVFLALMSFALSSPADDRPDPGILEGISDGPKPGSHSVPGNPVLPDDFPFVGKSVVVVQPDGTLKNFIFLTPKVNPDTPPVSKGPGNVLPPGSRVSRSATIRPAPSKSDAGSIVGEPVTAGVLNQRQKASIEAAAKANPGLPILIPVEVATETPDLKSLGDKEMNTGSEAGK